MYIYIYMYINIYKYIRKHAYIDIYIKLTKRSNLFMLKNKNEQLTGFSPTWSHLN